VFDRAHVDASVRVLSLLGWAFPLLLSGIEIDFDRLRSTSPTSALCAARECGLRVTLLWFVKRWLMFHEPVEVAGEVALDAAADLAGGLAFGGAAGGVGDGRLVVAEPADRDGVQGPVGVAVAVGVDAVAGGAA
jgi:hypothetical protein